LKENFYKNYGIILTSPKSIGISAMMHGYIVLDKNDKFLTPFRT
jgi:sugar (pentulose or hexulose) kinase